jgi:hypothetical protein
MHKVLVGLRDRFAIEVDDDSGKLCSITPGMTAVSTRRHLSGLAPSVRSGPPLQRARRPVGSNQLTPWAGGFMWPRLRSPAPVPRLGC